MQQQACIATRGRPRLLAGALAVAAFAAGAADIPKTGGPYVPTPQIVVDQMLRMANVGAGDFVVDLGSGDGIIVLSAAQQFKASGMGVDIDPELVKLSNASAQKLGVADRVRFVQLDVFKADLSKATVLTLYLLPEMMMNLRSKVFSELRPGTRVVSHDYHFGDWLPDNQLTFGVPEKEKVTGLPEATVYLWIVPAKAAGTWQLKVDGREASEITLMLKQTFQNVQGSITVAGRPVRPQFLSLRGADLSFALPEDKGLARYSGRVNGDAMEGSVEVPGVKTPVHWSATRIAAAKVNTE